MALTDYTSSIDEGLSRVGGFVAGCGQAAFLTLAHLYNGEPVSAGELTAVIQQSVDAGVTVGPKAAGGQSSAATMEWLASQRGLTLREQDYQSALGQWAGRRPIELGVSNAAAFGGNDANVQGHWVTILGRATDGSYIAADPNQPEASRGDYVHYTADQIRAAAPFAALVPTTDPPSGMGSGQATSTAGGLIDLGPLLSGAAQAFKRAGVFILGALLVIFGILLLVGPQLAQAGKAAGKEAAKAAVVA